MGCSAELAARARSALTTAFVAAGLCLAAAMLVPALLGLQRYVITGESMSGAFDRGSIVYAKEVAVNELRVGDVITYAPPPGAGPAGLVTHRIVSIRPGKRGEPVFRTKGDANASRDPWTFTLDAPVQARAEFSIPYLGYAFAALAVREVRLVAIGIPALLVALALVARMWREAGEKSRRIDEIVASMETTP